ncbi:MAG: hypothetical protein AB7L91_16780 [Dehalococcoidia bacterium]
MAAVRSVGRSDLIAKVRAIEATDLDGRRWPRYKTVDDSTIASMLAL